VSPPYQKIYRQPWEKLELFLGHIERFKQADAAVKSGSNVGFGLKESKLNHFKNDLNKTPYFA